MSIRIYDMQLYINNKILHKKKYDISDFPSKIVDNSDRYYKKYFDVTTHGTEAMKRETRLAEEIIEMPERGKEEISGHHHSDLHVDADHLARPCQVVDEDDELHPTFPLVRLISVEHGRLRKKQTRVVNEGRTD